jgi:hypothetical protein
LAAEPKAEAVASLDAEFQYRGTCAALCAFCAEVGGMLGGGVVQVVVQRSAALRRRVRTAGRAAEPSMVAPTPKPTFFKKLRRSEGVITSLRDFIIYLPPGGDYTIGT